MKQSIKCNIFVAYTPSPRIRKGIEYTAIDNTNSPWIMTQPTNYVNLWMIGAFHNPFFESSTLFWDKTRCFEKSTRCSESNALSQYVVNILACDRSAVPRWTKCLRITHSGLITLIMNIISYWYFTFVKILMTVPLIHVRIVERVLMASIHSHVAVY